MALLAPKPSFASAAATTSTTAAGTTAASSMAGRTFMESGQRGHTATGPDGLFSSPTESEFSEASDGLDSIRCWDEKKVVEWLHSIRCGQYEALFKSNNVTGETLLECDQKILSEMGIKKIGDRVRINVAIKQLRNKSTMLKSKRNRDSLAALESYALTPSSSDSPRTHGGGPSQSSSSKRFSRQLDPALFPTFNSAALKLGSRPSSPLADVHGVNLRAYRYAASPMEAGQRTAQASYFSQPTSADSVSGRRPETPGLAGSRSNHLRQTSSNDGLTPGGLPSNSPVIKIIHAGGQTKVVNVKFCRTADDVTSTVLKKLLLPETQFRNYCFYVLDGLDASPANCRRVSDSDLMAICNDSTRSERNRLILRRINDGVPDMEEVRKAAKLATDETQILHANAISSNNMRNQIKLQKLTGESWHQMQAPMSPVTTTDRNRNFMATADDYERKEAEERAHASTQASKLRTFFGARPPSEMIVQEISSYFPAHQKEDIEKTMRLSVRRSHRMSRAASRLSVMSNFSYASSVKDAPPVPAMPNIADAWLAQTGQAGSKGVRPLSVSSRFALPGISYRDSIASSTLQPLQEESALEPNRKSYVSFDSGSDSNARSEMARISYIDESPGGFLSENINERLSMMVAEDGEEEDAELNSFLAGNSFEKNNWMKGDLIGEGSFGSVYLALHAVTGELMAVKQVELPNMAKGTEGDKKKNNMITALKQEIELLQGLQHPHIVQYLGTSSDEDHLNIFLEYVPGGSIAAMLKQYNTFKEPLIRNFTRQILDGLSYLHSRNIIHRDIKGANILVDNRGMVKISDFGVSKKTSFNGMNAAPGTRTSLQGSVFWMAPEVVRQTGQSIKSDIWSVGCLIVEMFTGSRPFPSMTTLQTLFAVGSNNETPEMPEEASEEARVFLAKCFEADHLKRPGAEELLRERFLVAMA
ncbi:hypothetical protein DV736_g138, partial [Chaetothyriales sp. CBS 134916]